MSYGKAVGEELRVPTRQLRHAIPQVYAGYRELHDAALAPGVLDIKTKESIALAIAISRSATAASRPTLTRPWRMARRQRKRPRLSASRS